MMNLKFAKGLCSFIAGVLIFIFIAQIPNPGQAQTVDYNTISWTTTTPSIVGRAEAAGAVVDGKLYVFGGYTNTWTLTKRAYSFNPVTKTWSRIADLPREITHAGVAVDNVNKIIYLAGGYVLNSQWRQVFASEEVYKYDVATNTWSRSIDLPLPRGSGALAIVNNNLHFFGGADFSRIDQADHWSMPINGTAWISRPAIPTPRSHLGVAVLNGNIYAVGGQKSYDQYLTAYNSVDIFNPSTNTWSVGTPLPIATSHNGMATFTSSGRIFVMGGEWSHYASSSRVYAFNPTTNVWDRLTNLPASLHSGVGGEINGKLYYNSGGPTFSTTTYEGTPTLVK
ncbi:hypothetical protein H6G76_28190 [Nostoc sp. FACHB-152]|uniref:Kelch repeat-containing protein n=1 Tax=unclassified Nostoc TaxID=2593658 RepID=UPI00168A111F|nr:MULTISPECIES: kelch repeat-containing protein [unclassified Nostoc]MBD2450940.1 hypothetical protein [Nostoc sp. FACHB-152]MBD2471300.1 hypothetical protein [Nostoc sp. FACHB-145]